MTMLDVPGEEEEEEEMEEDIQLDDTAVNGEERKSGQFV